MRSISSATACATRSTRGSAEMAAPLSRSETSASTSGPRTASWRPCAASISTSRRARPSRSSANSGSGKTQALLGAFGLLPRNGRASRLGALRWRGTDRRRREATLNRIRGAGVSVHLPGADERARSALSDRRPDRRAADRPWRAGEAGGARARRRTHDGGRHCRRGARARTPIRISFRGASGSAR